MTNNDSPVVGPGLTAFESRLELCGDLVFKTALRVGAGRSEEVTALDLPVVKTVDGLPYIPGASFKGAWRAFTEAILRTVQDQPEVQDRNLTCYSASKGQERGPGELPDRCLTAREVQSLKARWQGDLDTLDRHLRERSCWTCRVFGAPWLAAKVLVRDLSVVQGMFLQTGVRDGVAIDRDTGTVSGGRKYQFETVPAETSFAVKIIVENASSAELGLAWLGLRAMEREMISLGGARSRGLGRCRFEPRWAECRYVTSAGLIPYLFDGNTGSDDAEWWRCQTMAWVKALKRAIGIVETAAQEGDDE
jgi:CRISPR-associated RAMP protein (TIGR02581 family)